MTIKPTKTSKPTILATTKSALLQKSKVSLVALAVAASLFTFACTSPGDNDKQTDTKQVKAEKTEIAEAEQEALAKQKYTIVKLNRQREEAKLSASADQGALAMVMSPNKEVYARVQPPSEPTANYSPTEYRDDFEDFATNPIFVVSENPVSTFSSDVDTASYSFVRRQLNTGYLPTKNAVRLEEMLNYFDYQYPKPSSANKPFLATTYVHNSPWAEDRKLVHIGIQGFEQEQAEQRDSNLVFLLDVSGSMNSPDKLPLVKQSMNLLLSQLKPTDTVSIVVYAGAAGQVLAPTEVKDKHVIMQALDNLSAGGSTAGGEGLKLAYQLAEQSFKEDGVNRIILATDGDFNVGISDREQLQDFVERKRESGVFLSVLGFGQGNYHDHLMQSLAQNGNGIAAYIDTLSEAQKVLVHEARASLFPIANDLKIQVEFNPKVVKEYRLLGYETRALAREDFKNDKVDAGDIGSGHSVTAIYEVTLVGSEGEFVEPLRYSNNNKPDVESHSNELAYLKMRYKLPGQSESTLVEQAINTSNDGISDEFSGVIASEAKFAAAVAGFAQMLKDGKYIGSWSKDEAISLALNNRGIDPYGYRNEFVQLIRKAELAQEIR